MLEWMFVCFRYVYEGLYILVSIMFKLFILALYACSCSWGCLPVCLVLVASSSPVRGSGTLQCAIRALVVAWAWMGHERLDSRGRFPSVQQKNRRKPMHDKRILENSSKYWNHRIIGGLSLKFRWCIESPSRKTTRRGTCGKKSTKNCLSFKNRRRLAPLRWSDRRNVDEG